MEQDKRKTPEEVQKVLDYYGADLDDSGEPDEAPEDEGTVILPTPDEEKQRQKEWAGKVRAWRKERGERS